MFDENKPSFSVKISPKWWTYCLCCLQTVQSQSTIQSVEILLNEHLSSLLWWFILLLKGQLFNFCSLIIDFLSFALFIHSWPYVFRVEFFCLILWRLRNCLRLQTEQHSPSCSLKFIPAGRHSSIYIMGAEKTWAKETLVYPRCVVHRLWRVSTVEPMFVRRKTFFTRTRKLYHTYIFKVFETANDSYRYINRIIRWLQTRLFKKNRGIEIRNWIVNLQHRDTLYFLYVQKTEPVST